MLAITPHHGGRLAAAPLQRGSQPDHSVTPRSFKGLLGNTFQTASNLANHRCRTELFLLSAILVAKTVHRCTVFACSGETETDRLTA